MRKYFNEDSKNFRKYWESVNRSDKKNTRKKLMDACLVDYQTIYNWLNGTCRIHPLAKPKIEEVAGQKIFSDNE